MAKVVIAKHEQAIAHYTLCISLDGSLDGSQNGSSDVSTPDVARRRLQHGRTVMRASAAGAEGEGAASTAVVMGSAAITASVWPVSSISSMAAWSPSLNVSCARTGACLALRRQVEASRSS